MLTPAISLLTALPLVLAAPTCSVRPAKTSSSVPAPSPTSVTPTNPSSGNTTTGAGAGGKIAMAWFADWHPGVGVSNISWSGYTHMSFFTAQPSSDGTIQVILSDPSMPQQFTTAAKANGVKPLLTVGGWDGSLYWSSSVATDDNRTTLANSLISYANTYGFDGLDFDWEYPNDQGIGCNTISVDDTANFEAFVHTVRGLAPNLTLSAAAPTSPWRDATGTPSTNVTSFAQDLDFIEIMNYDVYGTFSTVTGPNSPLKDSCAPSGDAVTSATSAVAAWTAAGFPASKIVLGVASYGHSFTVPPSTALTSNNSLNIYTTFDKTNIPPGDAWNPATTSADECGNPPVGNGNSGIYNFWGMIDAGFLTSNGSVASGMVGMFDECSETPFVYDSSAQILVSYDDTNSFNLKGNFIKQNGLAGFAVYEQGGDYNGLLVNAINQGMS